MTERFRLIKTKYRMMKLETYQLGRHKRRQRSNVFIRVIFQLVWNLILSVRVSECVLGKPQRLWQHTEQFFQISLMKTLACHIYRNFSFLLLLQQK